MKINVEIDITPEELRRFMGLPDVQGFQQQIMENYTAGIQESAEQQQEFIQNMFNGMMTPWQNMFMNMMGQASSSTRDKKD